MNLLFKPLAYIHRLILRIRHWAYDSGFFRSYKSVIPSIVIGNLSLGGSGKTPFVIYLAQLLSNQIHLATLSRGYGRTSNGYKEVVSDNDYLEYGDEPYLIKEKLDPIRVFVSEDRVSGIEKIKDLDSKINLVILDDAFQHRKLKAEFYILLTAYDQIFSEDELFPLGTLRDLKERAKLADLIIITKSPQVIPNEKLIEIETSIRKFSPDSPILYSSLAYGNPYLVLSKDSKRLDKKIVVLTGIANPKHLIDELKNQNIEILAHFKFQDHHRYTNKDIIELVKSLKAKGLKQLVTTEKDAVRLNRFKNLFKEAVIELVAIPIEMKLLESSESILIQFIKAKFQF